MNVEKNWLEEMVKSSDFEYFDGNEYLEVVAGQGKATPSGQVIVAGQGKATPSGQVIVAGQGKGTGNNVVYQAVPITTMPPVEKRLLQASPNSFTLHTQRKAPNLFTQYQQYDAVNNLFFDLIVKTTVRANEAGGGYPPDATYEVPILYPFANKDQLYQETLSNYGLLLKGATVHYLEGTKLVLDDASGMGKHEIEVDGMSFNLSDLYNAILYRNLKLQINKIRFALQEPDDVAYLNTLTMYAIGITSKIQKDSLNVGSFVRPQNFNTNIVDVDMRIVIDYNSILTYMINTAMVNKPASGDAVNTFRMSFFCNILR